MRRNGANWGALALVVVGVASTAAWAWMRLEARALHAELEATRNEAAELRLVRAENERLRARRVSPEQARALREAHVEAARLRAEIAALKQRMEVASTTAALKRSSSAGVDEHYEAVFGELGLDAAQTTRLRSLLIRRAEARGEVVDAAQREGRDPNGQTTQHEAGRARTDVEWQIRRELGEVRYAVFQEFEWGLSARRLVKQAEAMLARTPMPLRTEQVAALGTILARTREGEVFDPLRSEAYQIRLDEQAMQAAARVLSAEQMRALEFIRKGTGH